MKKKSLFKRLGPGFITGAADDDPSGIATYTQSGAKFGFAFAWMAFAVYPFITAIQEMCGRVGLVTGRGLADTIRTHYSKYVLYLATTLLVIANTLNIGSDLGAMAASVEMLVGGNAIMWLLLLTIIILCLEVFVTYERYAHILKFLTLSLFAYILTAFIIQHDWMQTISAIVFPHFRFDHDSIVNMFAILGTTLSPYLFFWQASEEVEEEIVTHRLAQGGEGMPTVNANDIKSMRFDTFIGMFFSNLVMLFIIITAGLTLFPAGISEIETATEAAAVLKPLAGSFASLLFTLGILGTGFLAVPILAGSAGYAVSETFRWKEGLRLRFSQAKGFYGVIILSTIVGLCLNAFGVPPFHMLYLSAISNGLCAPILLVLILLISNNKKIMGSHVNSMISNVLGIMITVVMSLGAMYILLQ